MNDSQKQLRLYTKVFFESGAFQVDHFSNPSRVKAIGQGVLRHYYYYLRCVEKMVKPSTLNEEKAFLMVCCYQIDQSNQVEKQTHACVEQASICGINKGFVNAVLRRYLKQREAFALKFRGDPCVQFNLCSGLLERIKQGHTEWRKLVSTMRMQPKVCLAVNVKLISHDDFMAKLTKEGIQYSKIELGVALEQSMPIRDIPGYQKGWFWVQSDSNQKLAQLLPKKAPKKILDMCAAPGGKTALLAMHYPEAKLKATDIDQERIERLIENKKRLRLSCEIEQKDWCNSPIETFDLIWVDVPCSSTGVIAKHPEIGVSERDWGLNHRIQHQLLQKAWEMLSPGGLLVYSTCSILSGENEEVVKRLTAEHEAAVIERCFPSALPTQIGTYFESEHSRDYVYGAVIQKAETT